MFDEFLIFDHHYPQNQMLQSMKKLIPLLCSALLFNTATKAQSFSMNCEIVSELTVPRYAHTMLYYSAGNFVPMFFIAGGYDNGGALATAEIAGEVYEMNFAHADHTSEKLADGRILVIAGWNGLSNLTIIEAFDPETMSFSMVADLEIPRSFHRSVVLNDGRVLITGGFDGNTNLSSCEIFNPLTNAVEPAASMNFGRSSHTCTLMSDGRVIVTGGYNPDNGFQQTSCEMYDPSTNTWENIAPLNSGRDNHAASSYTWDGDEVESLVVSGGRFFNADLNLFEGQSTFEVYDVEANTWTLISPDFSQPMYYHNMHVYDGFSRTFSIPGSIGNSGIDVQKTYYGRLDMWFESFPDSPITSQDPSTEYFAGEQLNIPGYLYASSTAPSMQFFYSEVYYSGGLKDEGVSSDLAHCIVNIESVTEVVLAPLKIYPTPAVDVVTVEWGTAADYEIQVFDTNGKIVFTNSGRGEKTQVPQLPSGAYVAAVRIAENALSSTFTFR
jgi:hypothetical protein